VAPGDSVRVRWMLMPYHSLGFMALPDIRVEARAGGGDGGVAAVEATAGRGVFVERDPT
jgi:hypothetical protein